MIKTYWGRFLFWAKFFKATGHTPNQYRKLFEQLSSRCLMPGSLEGIAMVAGQEVRCITTLQPIRIIQVRAILETKVQELLVCYDIDRKSLVVTIHSSDPLGWTIPPTDFWDPVVRPLINILNAMIKDGIPFSFSNDFVTELGI